MPKATSAQNSSTTSKPAAINGAVLTAATELRKTLCAIGRMNVSAKVRDLAKAIKALPMGERKPALDAAWAIVAKPALDAGYGEASLKTLKGECRKLSGIPASRKGRNTGKAKKAKVATSGDGAGESVEAGAGDEPDISTPKACYQSLRAIVGALYQKHGQKASAIVAEVKDALTALAKLDK